MNVYLVHHTSVLSAEQDPERHLSESGRAECARLGGWLKANGVTPVRILHSEKQWSLESAERIAEAMGQADKTALAAYPCNTGHDVAPFIKEIEAADGDMMMVGHADFLIRTASKLLCGNEDANIVAFKPSWGTCFRLTRDGDNWALTSGWRQEHLAA